MGACAGGKREFIRVTCVHSTEIFPAETNSSKSNEDNIPKITDNLDDEKGEKKEKRQVKTILQRLQEKSNAQASLMRNN